MRLAGLSDLFLYILSVNTLTLSRRQSVFSEVFGHYIGETEKRLNNIQNMQQTCTKALARKSSRDIVLLRIAVTNKQTRSIPGVKVPGRLWHIQFT